MTPLPKQNIDTGMGLERIAGILQGVTSNFETDILRTIMAKASRSPVDTYGAAGEKTDTSLRILGDHARAVAFMIADGILPSNEGRGYVLRRILRRAVRHGRLLGVEDPFLARLIDVVVDMMGAAYPELEEHHACRSPASCSAEEQRFGATLRQGLLLLEAEIERTQGATHGNAFDGAVAFTLHDTYGFPVELTSEIVAEAGLHVDMTAFEADMAAQRDRARAAVKDESWNIGELRRHRAPQRPDRLRRLRGRRGGREGAGDPRRRRRRSSASRPAMAAEIVLDATPFYGEQGGQVGDTGELTRQGRHVPRRGHEDPAREARSHRGRLEAGSLEVGKTRARRDRPPAPRAHPPQPHRDAPAALGAAPRARRAREAVRLVRVSGAPAVRLHALRGGHGRAAREGRAARATPRSWRTTRSARTRRRSTPPARWASPRCSARSTARSSACSRSATSARSCAAART